MKKKITAILASIALALSALFATAAPANAVYGAGVLNTGSLNVTIKLDSGSNVILAPWQSRAHNVRSVYVPAGSCVYIGSRGYCVSRVGESPIWVILSAGQYSVQRKYWGG